MTSASSRVRRGFTLIELLVVIAIIGILSAVVLASLNTARQKGGDAAVQSDLDGIRTEAEVYYNGTGANTYGTPTAPADAGNCYTTYSASGTSLFQADQTVVNAYNNALSSNGNQAGVCDMSASGAAYSMETPLKSGGYWCIDSTGQSKKTTTALAMSASAPACGT
jgi:prepilin-type N-terminal cleavage/methylation domain-containing protein